MPLQKIYSVSPSAPWGDYGLVLVHGLSRHLPKKGDTLQLERVGPYVPDFTLPSRRDAIFTTKAVQDFATWNARGQEASFVEVHKAKVVALDWSSWDRSSALPTQLPSNGEPIGYLDQGAHDADLSDAIGDLWVLQAPTFGDVNVRRERPLGAGRLTVLLDDDPPPTIFRATGSGYVLTTSDGAAWLREKSDGFLTFHAVDIAS